MLLGLQEVRDNIRNRDGKRVYYLGKGDQLTSEARDFLSGERIEILPAEQAKPEYFQILTGGTCQDKPEHMTHLYGNVLVPKTHPRIAFRGAVDCLEAELLLCIREAEGRPLEQLEEILAEVRKLIRWDVMGEPAEETELLGLTEAELRAHSHRPQAFYGQPHFMPSGRESLLLLRVNRARAQARQAELAAGAAFSDRDGNPVRPDLLRCMNRLSSALYLVMIELKKSGK